MHWFEHLASLHSDIDTPIYHMTAYTDIEIKLDINGKLVDVSSERLQTVIPATESSMVRTYMVAPHCLSDRLKYLAAGISEPHHSTYLRQLNEWADSNYSTTRLCAVRNYIESGTLLEDVLSKQADPSTFVRFTVDGIHLWEDKELIESHIKRMRENVSTTGLCCLTGEYTALANSHPKHILPAADTAKLISAESENLAQGTVRGGFSIGKEAAYKAHAVLKRILAEYGVTIGIRTFAAWDDLGTAIKLPINGQTTDFYVTGNITVISLAAATKGRISVTFLRRMPYEIYSQRLRKWNGLSLTMRSISDTAFGRRFGNKYICPEGVYSQTTERLLGCILDDTPIPSDIIRAVQKRNPDTAEKLYRYNGEHA